MQNRMELIYVSPFRSYNGTSFAQVDLLDVESEMRRWENAVVAYYVDTDSIHGPSSFNKFIDNLIASEWGENGEVKVYSQGSAVFVLDFENIEGKELALAEGPRFYDGSRPLILKPWSPDLSFGTKELKSAPIWIKLPNLRLHLWSPEALSKIASLVGRQLFTDAKTASRKELGYARICVEVEIDKVLPDVVTIQDWQERAYAQKVEYERQPPIMCSDCLYLGHSDSCPKRKKPSP